MERSDSVLRSSGERWCRRRSKSSECCARKTGMYENKRNAAHLAKEVMIIREDALDKLESECLMEVLELQELWALSISQKTQVLEDGKCVARSRPQRLGCSIW